MKVVLVNPDYMLYADPPLGLAYLAAYIKEKGFNVRILDQLKEKEIENKIREINPKVIGISAVSQNYYHVKELARKIKKISNALLVIGGVHITTSPESFKSSVFDIAVRGEGEIAFIKLIESVKKNDGLNIKELKKIRGLLFRDKGKIIDNGLAEQIADLDELPFPARELLNMRYYTLPSILSEEDFEPFGAILTSRGCPYNCKFCSSSCFWGRKIRFFSAKRVVDEVELLNKKYGYKKIFIYDDLFTVNKGRLKEIIKLMKNKNLLGKIRFYVYGRANNFDEETAKLLKEMNTVSVTFGFESGSQKILNYLKGGSVSVKDNEKAVKIAKKYGIIGDGFFMIGNPFETLEDIKKTYDFIKKNCKENFITYQTIPFPGTEVWKYAVKNKIIKKDFYEKKQKDFIDVDTNILLTKEISKEDFKKTFYEIRGLAVQKNKSIILRKLRLLKPKHIIKMLSLVFIRKVNNLKGRFIKRLM